MEKIKYNNYIINVDTDADAESPRNWDNLGKILYVSSRYILGDASVSHEDIAEITSSDENFSFPVYAYIHSGIKLSLGAFSDRFDSGQCGIIYCTKQSARDNWPEASEEELEGLVKACFVSEIDTFNQFMNGEVYCYHITDGLGNDMEISVCGHYDRDEMIREAKEEIDLLVKNDSALIESFGDLEPMIRECFDNKIKEILAKDKCEQLFFLRSCNTAFAN